MGSLTSPSSSTSPSTEPFPKTPSISVPPSSEKPDSRYHIYLIFSYKKHPNDLNTSCVMGCYDPSINSWTHESTIPETSVNHILKGFSMVSVKTSIYIIGGSEYRKQQKTETKNGTSRLTADVGVRVRSTVLRYDVVTKEWFTCAPLITPRYDFACSVFDDKIYVAGGQSTLDGAKGISSSEVYDVFKNEWRSLPSMSTVRYKCVGVTWQKKFHVIGGFTYSENNKMQFFTDRCSAEVYDVENGKWDHVTGMWQLDVPPNQIVVVGEKLISSGDCLNVWKGHIETYDGDLNLWNPVDGSRKENLLSVSCSNNSSGININESTGSSTSTSESLQRICLTMAPIGGYLYFIAGYRVAGGGGDDQLSSCCTMSMVHRFDTSAMENQWETYEPMQVEGERELCSHCCVVKLS